MLFKSPFSYLNLLLLLIVVLSCKKDDISSLPLDFPANTSSAWYYSVYDYTTTDTLKIGTAETRITGSSTFEGKTNILEFVRRVQLDSLASTALAQQTTTSRFIFEQGYLHLFADSYFDLYDNLLGPVVLDTIAANEPGGPDFQSFRFVSPKWVKWLNVEWDPEFSHTVFENQVVFIDFKHRSQRIHGSAKLSMESRFDAYDRVLVRDTTSVVAYRYLNKGFIDFSLKRDTIDIPSFRTTVNLYIWIHETGGILKRDRKPIELFIPQVPSRFPILYVPGQFWQVDSTVAVNF